MQFLTRSPTRQYFISIFAVVSTLFIIFSVTIYHQYSQAQKLNAWVIYNYEVNRQSRKILFDLVNMETGVRGYLLSGKKSFLEPYISSRKSVAAQINALWALTKNDPTTQSNIDIWLKKIEIFFALLSNQVETLNEKGVKAVSQNVLEMQRKEMDDLRTLLEDNTQTRLQDLQGRIVASQDKQNNFRYILIIGTVLAIGGMLLATLVILTLLARSQRAQEEAKAVEERLLHVVNSIDDGLFDFNLKEGTVFYSPAYKAMLGYTDEEHPNTIDMFNSTLHPDDFDTIWETLNQYKKGILTTHTHAFRLQHKDGHWVWILSRGVGLADAKGTITRLIGTHTDITAHKNREDELEQLNNEMETFAYITSHDLRAPLVNLKGFAGEIEHAVKSIDPVIRKLEPSLNESERSMVRKVFDEEIPESIRFIVQSVKKMDQLTTALLDLSRIGKRHYRQETVDTQAIVKQCLDTLAYEITQKDIEVLVGDLPSVTSDSLALEQIFGNILDNAVKYLDPERKGKIAISSMQIGKEVVFSIKDNGRGIVDADKEKVFQVFRRARNTADIRGLGMGMTYIQATLRQLGGAIWFESAYGVGTTFHFSLSKHVAVRGRNNE